MRIRINLVRKRAVLSLTPKRMISLLKMDAMAVCRLSSEDAASPVTAMSTTICQAVLKGARRSKNARSGKEM